jgi:O-antigen/teichoic acid export membrane protein
MAQRKRRFGSIAVELIKKAREAMLTAVQIYNNPQIEFKSELFIVTTVVAWTYLLHAFYRKRGIEYRQFRQAGKRRRKTMGTRRVLGQQGVSS